MQKMWAKSRSYCLVILKAGPEKSAPEAEKIMQFQDFHAASVITGPL